MEIRTTKPTNNKFYQTINIGGYSTCITGSPTDKDSDVLANCVGYACGRFNEIIGAMKYPSLNCNAENFITRAKEFYPELKIETDISKGRIGDIIVWEGAGDLAGHVAIIEKVYTTSDYYTSESAYNSTVFYNSRRDNSNGRLGMSSNYKFLGFIQNPAIEDNPPVILPEQEEDKKKDLINYYLIKSGDTLSNIAKNNKTTIKQILNLNPEITDKNKIIAGSTIIISIDKHNFKINDKVNLIEYVNSDGQKLKNYDSCYYITQFDSNGITCVLSAIRNNSTIIWARVNINNLILEN